MVRKSKSKAKAKTAQKGGFLPMLMMTGKLFGGKKTKRKQKGGIVAMRDAFGRIIRSPWIMS